MKSVLSFGLLICIIGTFLNCDGRDRLKDHKKTSLEASNQQKSLDDNITYIPESYSEKVTDTILKNGYKIYTKTYTDLNSYVEINVESHTNNNINYKKRYYNFITELKIYNPKNKLEFITKIDKPYLINIEALTIDKANAYVFKSFNLLDSFEEDDLSFELIYKYWVDIEQIRIILNYNKKTKALILESVKF